MISHSECDLSFCSGHAGAVVMPWHGNLCCGLSGNYGSSATLFPRFRARPPCSDTGRGGASERRGDIVDYRQRIKPEEESRESKRALGSNQGKAPSRQLLPRDSWRLGGHHPEMSLLVLPADIAGVNLDRKRIIRRGKFVPSSKLR